MPINKSVKKVIIIGSGPIVIGQAAEFDYSGTQACKAVREEGIETVLVNSNPATIMTDADIADKVYIEPLTVECLEKIIEKEHPDGILAGFGGQTALNLAMDLEKAGILEKHDVKLLGIDVESIKKAEDRELFKEQMINIREPIANSIIATNLEQCRDFASVNGFPVIIRPAYTLGGTGGGIANNNEELDEICTSGINNSPIGQILLEQSVAGWKEIEYEVIRDNDDNCIIVCNMENIDPVGVHTGDSIVVAPSQTLRDKEYQMLRQSSIKIVRSLEIRGGCNVQFALDPNSDKYIVIEVNPRVSRSSALASKAAGYPIAKIAAKIAIGYSLAELKNYVTKSSSACFEPTLDYVVVKIPKWPFDKFRKTARTLGTQMKATGEVMAIGRSFESALLKAIGSLEVKSTGLKTDKLTRLSHKEIITKIRLCDDERIFAIAQALRMKITVDKIFNETKIDRWFLNGMNNIIAMENKIAYGQLNAELLYQAKSMGFLNDYISELSGLSVEQIDDLIMKNSIYPIYKMVDTCGGEFEAETPYYYSSYEQEDENIMSDGKKIIVLGSGPIRIGQGIEFDYCCVHGVKAIKECGYSSIIINNNPETVSTDFDTADKLYFEPLNIENVMNIIEQEQPEGVIVQFGGQTSLNLAEKLYKKNINILGTSFESIDLAEDRGKFSEFLDDLCISSPDGTTVINTNEAFKAAEELGYPVVVRPSYVIGGRAMKVVYDKSALEEYITEAVSLSSEHPVLIDKYVKGIEIEVDAVSDGEDILIPGIMEHVERTGIHSGDSITIYPPINLSREVIETLVDYTSKIALKLKTIGLINIQYVYDGKEIHVIEVNPRASRTVPILSKVTGVPMVKLAFEAMIGRKLKNSPYGIGLKPNQDLYAVKAPVFSTRKINGADIHLGPEMKSTGEILGIDTDVDKAVYKAFRSSGIKIPVDGAVYISLNDIDKLEGVKIAKDYQNLGFKIYSSEGTNRVLVEYGIKTEEIKYSDIENMIMQGKLSMIVNTPTLGDDERKTGYRIRKKAQEYNIPVFTSIETARIFKKAINVLEKGEKLEYRALNEYFK
ncbi:carbamoyl-phosphate synthase (glutamine-hydrolyzing) large subunit [Brassicibacter mesophilus]|uniref:carbamoyl-phosphate synthase (glutamine-hydrolyzing) large subunit n=1 Tax=Brassicibacter mesophilus TaxID=745119 RepID=UPI003D19C5F9